MIALVNHQGLKVMKGLQLQSPSPPIGLAYVGGYLKQNGFDYTAVDACGLAMDSIRPYRSSKNIFIQGLTVEEVVARIPVDTRIVGFTCLFSHCWPLVEDMAKAIRKVLPGALLVAGGEHPTAGPDQVFRSGLFDVVVKSEGEETFLELVKRVAKGADWRDVDGIAFMERGSTMLTTRGELKFTPPRKRITEIDKFPYPDWDNWCIEEYINHGQVTGINLGRMIPILGSRGCPYACKFCSNEYMWTRRYIMRDPKGLVDEMQFMKSKYNVAGFTFMDSTFVVNRNKTLAFARELVARRLNVTYQLPAGTRCEAFDDELAAALAESGLRNFAFAPESASERILQAVRKQVEIKKLVKSIDVVLKTPMTVCCFFVIGFPEDDRKSMKETLQFIRFLALRGVHDVTVSKFTPYPGSDYFIELRNKGRFSDKLTELEAVINFYSSDNKSYSDVLSSGELHRWMLWMYLNFYILSFLRRPQRVLASFINFFRDGLETTRYMRLFSELFVRRKTWRATVEIIPDKAI